MTNKIAAESGPSSHTVWDTWALVLKNVTSHARLETRISSVVKSDVDSRGEEVTISANWAVGDRDDASFQSSTSQYVSSKDKRFSLVGVVKLRGPMIKVSGTGAETQTVGIV